MELHFENETTIKNVQIQFNALYPFLQLQFLISLPAENKPEGKMEKAHPELSMKRLRPIPTPTKLSIANKITVAQLLKSFEEIGLHAQVCRKSGNHWVETSLTDDWTLERQNREAILISIS